MDLVILLTNISKYSNSGNNYQFSLSTDADDILVPDNDMTTVNVIARVIAGDGSIYAKWSNPILLES